MSDRVYRKGKISQNLLLPFLRRPWWTRTVPGRRSNPSGSLRLECPGSRPPPRGVSETKVRHRQGRVSLPKALPLFSLCQKQPFSVVHLVGSEDTGARSGVGPREEGWTSCVPLTQDHHNSPTTSALPGSFLSATTPVIHLLRKNSSRGRQVLCSGAVSSVHL